MNKKRIEILILGMFLVAVILPNISGIQTYKITEISNENRFIDKYSTRTVLILNTQPYYKPVAKFFWTPENPELGEEITFNASSSNCFHLCRIVSYEWDLDEDNICDDANGLTVTCCHNIQDVYEITLKVTDDWSGSGETTKSIDFRNPPETPTITGESSIKINKNYTCYITTTDPDQDNIYFKINSGVEITDWLGPFESGETITKVFTYNNQGNYTIKVKAKDATEAESNWGSLKITVSKGYTFLKFYEYPKYHFSFFEKILKQILL
jgi:hypothetical protein